jgi:hypothetical protein
MAPMNVLEGPTVWQAWIAGCITLLLQNIKHSMADRGICRVVHWSPGSPAARCYEESYQQEVHQNG